MSNIQEAERSFEDVHTELVRSGQGDINTYIRDMMQDLGPEEGFAAIIRQSRLPEEQLCEKVRVIETILYPQGYPGSKAELLTERAHLAVHITLNSLT